MINKWITVKQNDESGIIDNTPNNTLTKGDFNEGQYFSIQFDENQKANWQISPKIKLTFSFIPKKENISYVKIEKFKKEKGKWTSTENISLSNFGFSHIARLLSFLKEDLDLKSVHEKKIRLTEGSIGLDELTIKRIKTVLSDPLAIKYFKEIIEGIISSQQIITTKDIISIGYRKSQVDIFSKLLYENSYIEKYRQEYKINKEGNEAVWQHFFENNNWILGYGLSYIWCGPFDDDPIEKVLSGNTFFSAGKKADGVLGTIADIKNFVIVELKLPENKLLKQEAKPYRKECWRISDDLTGGISQSQKTKYKFLQKLETKIELTEKNGDPTGQYVYAIKPKSYLIIGKLSEFKIGEGVNDEKFSSFELFRNSNIDPEIITYDELYQRARHMLKVDNERVLDTIEDEEPPF